MNLIKQSTATRALRFLMVDSTDHLTGKPGLAPAVTISKNGGAFAAPAGAVTEIANGWYKIAANATDSNTLGAVDIHATAAGADPTDVLDAACIVAYDPDAGTVLLSAGTGTGQLDFAVGVVKSNLSQILGTALTETAGQIATAFKKFFNIATPAATMDHGILVDTATTVSNRVTANSDLIAGVSTIDGLSLPHLLAALLAGLAAKHDGMTPGTPGAAHAYAPNGTTPRITWNHDGQGNISSVTFDFT